MSLNFCPQAHTPEPASPASAGTPEPTTPSHTPPAPDPAWLEALVTTLVQQDDEGFALDLLTLTRRDDLADHLDLLWRPRILARLYALPDAWVTSTVLGLAKPDHGGLAVLYDERILSRLVTLRRGHLRGTFLPYARQLDGFDTRDFLDALKEYRAAHPSDATQTGTPLLVSMETVEAQPVTWLWWPYIAVGKLTMLDGDPGTGKSLLVTQLAATLSQGLPLPNQDGQPTLPIGGPHTTLLLSTEDGLADTLKPRLDAAGADASKVKVLTGWADAEGQAHAFSLQHLGMLEQVLQDVQPRLVVIDPIQAYLGARVDMHRANETRPLLEQLRRLAEQYQCAILCVRHPAKPGGGGGGKAIHRGLGSVDFIGAARTGLFVEQHPLDEGQVLLTQSKSNLGPLGRTQVFTKYQGQFEWCGISRLRAELLAGSGRGPDPHVFLETVCWLEARLEGGVPLLATTVQAEAEEEGVNSATLRRAKKALGVRSTKQGEVWYWQLPGLVGLAPPASVLPHAPLGQHDPLEHLPEYQRDASTLPATDGQAAPDVVATQGGDATAIESSGLSVEPVENMEGVQEAQGQHVGHETDASRTASTSMPCPHCRRATTWVLRGGIPFCYKCHTRAPRGR